MYPDCDQHCDYAFSPLENLPSRSNELLHGRRSSIVRSQAINTALRITLQEKVGALFSCLCHNSRLHDQSKLSRFQLLHPSCLQLPASPTLITHVLLGGIRLKQLRRRYGDERAVAAHAAFTVQQMIAECYIAPQHTLCYDYPGGTALHPSIAA